MGMQAPNKTAGLSLYSEQIIDPAAQFSFTLSQGSLTFNDKFTQIVLSVCYKLCYGQSLYSSKQTLCRYVPFFLAYSRRVHAAHLQAVALLVVTWVIAQ